MLEQRKGTTEIEEKSLIRAALQMLPKAYAPYSGFFVAAAVLGRSGRIYAAVNVENASFPAGSCAERNAVCKAVSEGENELIAAAIVGGKGGKVTDYTPPCGVCRQVLREFADPASMKIILAKTEEDYHVMTLETLLPKSFGPEKVNG